MQSSALRLASPHPRANAFEVFQGDCTLCALSRLDKLFADRVVDVFGEALLLACQFAQAAFGALGALLLQFGAQTAVPIAHVVHALALMNRTIRVSGDIDHAQIDAEHVVHVLRVGSGHLARHQQIPRAAMEHQIALALASTQILALSLATHERNAFAALQRPDRHRLIGQGKRQNAIIVGDCG